MNKLVAIVVLLIGQEVARSATPVPPAAVPVLRAIYLREFGESQTDLSDEKKALDRLLSRRSIDTEGAALALLHFGVSEASVQRISEYLSSRGPHLLRLIAKFRRTMFVVPGREFRFCMRMSPLLRERRFVGVLRRLGGKGESRSRSRLIAFIGAFDWDLWSKIAEDQTPQGDTTLVLLLNFQRDAGYSQELELEIANRGKRMLPLLREHQVSSDLLLIDRFPRFAEDYLKRYNTFQWLIELIESGEKLDH